MVGVAAGGLGAGSCGRAGALMALLVAIFSIIAGCDLGRAPRDRGGHAAHADGAGAGRADAALVPARAALDASASLSEALTAGDLEAAKTAGRDLRLALPALPLPEAALAAADAALADLNATDSLAEARRIGAGVNRATLVPTAALAGGADGLHLFSCPMVEGGAAPWAQRSATLTNPYLTESMPRCGSALPWPAPVTPASAASDAHPEGVAFHTCPMHPSVRQPGPGTCPLCGMDLLPVTVEELEAGQITVDAARRQRMGLRTATLQPEPMVETLRLLGQARWDEGAEAALVSRVEGYVSRSRVDAVGATLERGAVALELYSPELVAVQEELLLFSQTEGAGGARARAARDRLLRFGLAGADVDAIVAAGVARPSVPLRAPVSGVVVEKSFYEGTSVMPGQSLLRLARPDPIWVELRVYESDVEALAVGQRVSLRRSGASEVSWTADITQINPWVDPVTRTAAARLVIDNPDGALLNGALLEATVEIPRGMGLLAPVEAVMVLGQKRLVFVDLGEGRLSPREVVVGRQLGERVELRSGISAGEPIVVSGNFLIAAESRLRSAAALWDDPPEVAPAAP